MTTKQGGGLCIPDASTSSAGGWKCLCCLVPNDENVRQCVCCQKWRHGFEVQEEDAKLNGTGYFTSLCGNAYTQSYPSHGFRVPPSSYSTHSIFDSPGIGSDVLLDSSTPMHCCVKDQGGKKPPSQPMFDSPIPSGADHFVFGSSINKTEVEGNREFKSGGVTAPPAMNIRLKLHEPHDSKVNTSSRGSGRAGSATRKHLPAIRSKPKEGGVTAAGGVHHGIALAWSGKHLEQDEGGKGKKALPAKRKRYVDEERENEEIHEVDTMGGVASISEWRSTAIGISSEESTGESLFTDESLSRQSCCKYTGMTRKKNSRLFQIRRFHVSEEDSNTLIAFMKQGARRFLVARSKAGGMNRHYKMAIVFETHNVVETRFVVAQVNARFPLNFKPSVTTPEEFAYPKDLFLKEDESVMDPQVKVTFTLQLDSNSTLYISFV
eukprot:GHVU01125734.1.p1 GENE.GHVU01125734.1~~GHVU01125734.1.p1  ORF type:complete len:435 (-),score=33.25 GHVU01125734.1:983-2287(-)